MIVDFFFCIERRTLAIENENREKLVSDSVKMFKNQMIEEKNGDKQREKEIQNKKNNVWENNNFEVEIKNEIDLVSKGEIYEEIKEIEMRIQMKLLLNEDEDEKKTDVEFNGPSFDDYKVSLHLISVVTLMGKRIITRCSVLYELLQDVLYFVILFTSTILCYAELYPAMLLCVIFCFLYYFLI